jgi:hypothetical protein
MRKCENCQIDLSGKQKKWCSSKCKCSVANFKHQNYQSQQERGRSRKRDLIKMKGGGCEICGYKKSMAALCFHHLDPSDKKFELDIRNLSNRRWDYILDEAFKCQLLCSNCHMEIHHGLEE